MDPYENDPAAYEDDSRDYDHDRSRSPRRDRDRDGSEARNRSASPNGRAGDSHGPPADYRRSGEENSGSNLFITSLDGRVKEEELRELFSQYGNVQNASIMRDPHSGDSRGFGFVKMALVEQAEAAMEKLHGHEMHSRAISVEKARRNRPRTPTPGKYHGPPKRDDYGFGRRRERFDDRRGGRRDDYRGYGGRSGGGDRYGDRYGGDRDRGSDRGGDRRYRDRADQGYGGGSRGIDRYSGARDDRYGNSRGDDRYGYGSGGAGARDDRVGGYGREAPPPPAADTYGGARGFDDRR